MNEAIAQKIDIFFSQYRIRKYAKGQVLILNGDQCDYVYHLLSGLVKQYDVTYRGDEVIINIFKPPAFFPMSLAINKTINPYIYEAETTIEVHQVPADEAVAFIRDNPDVLFDLLSRVYRGVDGLLGRMTHLMSGSAQSRLLYEIILAAHRFGTINKDGGHTLAISEKDLAARAGLSRETVSREVKKLKEQRLIILQTKGMLIPSLEALEHKLGREV